MFEVETRRASKSSNRATLVELQPETQNPKPETRNFLSGYNRTATAHEPVNFNSIVCYAVLPANIFFRFIYFNLQSH